MEITQEQENVLDKAIYEYGSDAQLDMVVEECSELIKAVCKFKRHKSTANGDEILKECADVVIMVKQALIIINSTDTDLKKEVNYKINRLKERLENN